MHFMDENFMNLGEEVTLTLLWQSGASESVTACFVVSLNICYWLLKCGVLRVVDVCERERVTSQWSVQPSEIILIMACVQTHTSIITVSVTRLCSPLGLELMVKLRSITAFTLILKVEACDYGKGRYIYDPACGVWLSTTVHHNALCQLANQSRLCLSEGGTL